MIKAVQKLPGLIKVALAVIILFTCCRKEETLIGKKLIPGSAYVNGIFTDTVTLKTKTIREDSLITENNPQFVLGAMKDGVFGNDYAGIYTQLVLNSAGISITDTTYVDSFVLSLNITGFYGDSNAVNNIRVFRLKDSISGLNTTIYNSRKTFATDILLGQKLNYKIGKRTIDTSYTDVDAQNFGPSLRIRLDTSIGHQIITQSPTGAFTDNSTFLQYFKGVYIDEDTTSGVRNSLIYLNLQGGQSFAGVYYHTPYMVTHPGVLAENVFRIYTSAGAINTNYFNHNFRNKIVQAALLNATKTVDTSLYVQSMAGTKTWITVPYLSRLGNILINEAQIVVTMAPSDMADTSIYPPPAQMELVVADSLFRNSEVLDQTFPAGYPTYGGNKTYTTNANGYKYITYTFSIAGELQKLVSHINPYVNEYNGFYLVTYPSNEIGDRIIVGGGSRKGDPYQMKLNLVYTKIP